MPSNRQKIHNAYQHCLSITQNHYENFPVASKLLNKQLRLPISAVYAFARSADDFADEGNLNQLQRLDQLNEYIAELDAITKLLTQKADSSDSFYYQSNNLIFIALADTLYRYQIPVTLFYDLLSAFKQDVTTSRYKTFAEILDYCRLSANPVGRILLYLNKSATEENLKLSDAICSALQLINFYQDIAQDMDENNRLYLPLDEMQPLAITENTIRQRINNKQTQQLLVKQLQRTKKIYNSGKPLCRKLSGRFALEIRMIYTGGQIILDKLEQNTTNIYLRPRLTSLDKFNIIRHGLFFS